MIATELKDVGIDYLRLTTNDEEAAASLLEASRIILIEDERLGYKVQPGGQIGFYGRRGRHCFFGRRQDWSMLQVSGFQAREHTNMLLRQRSRATRIDLQITLHAGTAKQLLMESSLDGSIRQRPENGKKWKTKEIREDSKLQTIYIGKRASEWFGRIYDKYEESGKEEYKDCVRFEIEIKGDAAKEVWAALQQSDSPRMLAYSIVRQWYEKHGVLLPPPPFGDTSFRHAPKEKHNEDRKLAWLQRMVSGTVAQLCATGHWFPVFEALFAKALTEVDRSGILFSMALIEGN